MVEAHIPVVQSRDTLCEKAIEIFIEKFQNPPAAVACGAGRVNLIVCNNEEFCVYMKRICELYFINLCIYKFL